MLMIPTFKNWSWSFWHRLDHIFLLLKNVQWLPVTHLGQKPKPLSWPWRQSLPSHLLPLSLSTPKLQLTQTICYSLNPLSVLLPQSLCVFPLPGMIFLWMATWLAPSTVLHTSWSRFKCHLLRGSSVNYFLQNGPLHHLPFTFSSLHFITPNIIYLYTICPCPIRIDDL